MYTSNPDADVPEFLIDIAHVIFKAGSSLHLLRREERFIDGPDSPLKLYYDICSSFLNKKTMSLEFEIGSLRESTDKRLAIYT